MTAKTAAAKKRGPAKRAKSKTDAMAGKKALDKASQVEGRMDDFDNRLSGIEGKVDSGFETLKEMLNQKASSVEVPPGHDPSAKVAQQVLREEEDDMDIPAQPENVLPAHLRQAEAELGSQKAKSAITELPRHLDTDDLDIGQQRPRSISSEGPAREAIDPVRHVDGGIVQESRISKEKLEIEVFMHEYVYVRLHETTDETQVPMPLSINGGVTQYFIRGKPQWVRRMFIEPLARAKVTTFTQDIQELPDGGKRYRMIPHTALLYPFEVLKDTDKGRRWLRNILREPA